MIKRGKKSESKTTVWRRARWVLEIYQKEAGRKGNRTKRQSLKIIMGGKNNRNNNGFKPCNPISALPEARL